jgi:hypothetical protein
MSDDKTIDGFLVRDRDKATKTTKEESRYEFLLRVIENVKTVAKEQLQRKRFKKNDDDEDKELELESLETYHDRRKDAQFVLIELRRANRDAMLEMEEKKLKRVERKRKEVEKIGKKVLSAEYEKSHLTMEMQSRQGIATSEDALKFDFVDEETFLKSEKKNKNNKMSPLTTKNKNAFAERRLEDELERRKELLERIEGAKERKISLQRSKLEREEKKREAENAIKDLKRTAAMVGEKFKTIIHQEKK